MGRYSKQKMTKVPKQDVNRQGWFGCRAVGQSSPWIIREKEEGCAVSDAQKGPQFELLRMITGAALLGAGP